MRQEDQSQQQSEKAFILLANLFDGKPKTQKDSEASDKFSAFLRHSI